MGFPAYRPDPAMTDMQERMAYAVSLGLKPTDAARVAGYSAPSVVGSRLARDERVRAVVHAARVRRIDKLASLSLRELEVMIRDRKVSAAVRFNAIKLSLALAGHVEPKAPGGDDANPLNAKAIGEMSVAELDAFLAREKARRADAAKPVIDQESGQRHDNPLKDNEKTQPLPGSGTVFEGSAVPVDGADDVRGALGASSAGSEGGPNPPPGG